MKFLLLKCQWCGGEGRFGLAEGPRGWIEREGTAPEVKRDELKKWTEPVSSKLDFCGDKCNQKAKEAECVAQKAADKAWLETYQSQKVTT